MSDQPEHYFPRRSGAQLYSGAVEYVGIAAVFTLEAGEVIVLAPNFTALCEHAKRWGIPFALAREKCRTARLLESDVGWVDEPAVAAGPLENPS